jgi:ketosteroid isomerase-like protein
VSENLDLVQSTFARWQSGDFAEPQRWADPEIEWVVADGPTAGSWKGLPAMEESFGRMLVAWEEWRIHAEEYRVLDDERVLVLTRHEGQGKTSGLDLGRLHTQSAEVYHVRDGRVIKIVHYYDRDRALADLGLEE